MNAEDLFRAIGQADVADLEHSETQETKRKRILPRIGLIAAVAAVLCMTAMAIPPVRNLLFGIKVQQNRVAAISVFDGVEMVAGGSAEVRMDVTIPQDAPATVETAYVPLFAAENWKPIAEQRTVGTPETAPISIDLGWEDGKGNYALFRQLACPGYTGDYTVECVDLGFNADYEIAALKLGNEEVQCITVQPSSVVGEGLSAKDGGRRKLFWSDGSYLFSMEVNFDMTDAMLQTLYESVTQVEDIEQYRKTIYVPAPQLEYSEVKTPYHLTEVPEGWSLTEGGEQPDGSYRYLFYPDDEIMPTSLLMIVQTCEQDYYRSVLMGWETEATEHTAKNLTIGSSKATAFCAENRNELLWRTEDGTFYLVSDGLNCLSLEQLTQIALSLKP